MSRIKDMHIDIVRQLKSTQQNILFSGSDDGCLNKYDLTLPADDMLVEVLNVNNGIKKFNFVNENILHIMSHTHTASIWDVSKSIELSSIDRTDLSWDYLIDATFSNGSWNFFGGLQFFPFTIRI
jgi:hypothetical protein